MELILWRHAEADERKEGVADLDRLLTPRGVKHAKRMGRWLAQNCPASMRVLVSPALRCQQTADALERAYTTVSELGPDATASRVLELARWPRAEGSTVLIVGHQPTLGQCIATLLLAPNVEIAMPKGAVWWLSNRVREEEEEERIVVRAVMTPRLL